MCRCRSTCRSVMLLLCLEVWCWPRTALGRDEYIINHVSGLVYAWLPWAGDWHVLKPKDRVPVGALIQCLQQTEISFVPAPGSAAGLTSASLVLVSPAMFRLSANVMRSFQVSEASSSEEMKGNSGEDDRAKPVADDPLPLTIAWERQGGVSLFMENTKDIVNGFRNVKSLSITGAKSAVLARNMIKDIKITFPTDGMLLPTIKPQEELMISWVIDGMSKRPMIEVYIWPKDKERGVAVTTTNSEVIPVTLAKGGYFIQLATPDLSYQSKTIYIAID